MANVDQVADWIENFVRSFDFTRKGVDQSLGRDMARAVAAGIADRAASQRRGADPSPWDDNEDDYAAEKEKAYGWVGDAPNFRTGQMLSLGSLFGRTRVEPQLITMVYGMDVAPDRTYSPRDARTASQKRADEDVTDVQKAEWAHAGTNTAPARPFYELDDDVRSQVIDVVADALRDYILTGS